MILEDLGFCAGKRTLIYGIGNVSRQDDGLGIRFVEKLETAGLSSSLTLEANYQLNIEDALLISEYDIVLFVDASKEETATEPFSIRAVEPESEITFTTHSMAAGAVLSLCERLYHHRPKAFLLAIPGYLWNLTEELSPQASGNLEQAFDLLHSEFQCMRSQ